MTNIQTGIFIFIFAFIITTFFTFFIRRALRYADIKDNPIVTEHRHKAGTPTMGGLAILLGFLLVACAYPMNKILVLTAIIMMTAGIIGLLDDLIGLKTKEYQKLIRNVSQQPVEIGRLTLKHGENARVTTPKAKKDLVKLLEEEKVEVVDEVPIKKEIGEGEKIFAQILISLFLVVSGAVSTSVMGINVGLFIIPIIVMGIVGSINSVNLIDGMDGLAAGILAIASTSCAIFAFSTGNIDGTIPFLVLAGTCFGFLVFNKYPASIFMGDTGSFALGAGYITAAFLGNVIYFAVIALAIPIISVIVSLMHRAHIIKLPVEPLHHTLNYKGMSEQKIVGLYWGLTILVCAAAIYFYHAI
ncbi:glycosyltransferase family 4 protein [Methanobacterium aggregans]|uniref:glycosyltransferase family 4 protein n=1 Tax=Methanobacterium aggregans TaxID=1615586 RepID=UPI001AE5164A|nr:phospho-N-acetylmuramoyl-pentapeptide-transferase [Methanobacterium aggregans]MBP2045560.1 phospho-N-acetylmuramoyl-pentapeptide-transferase [Methanobacterium aggregans]